VPAHLVEVQVTVSPELIVAVATPPAPLPFCDDIQ
jgi:hypothetical protein